MAINDDVMLALLAFDAYNQGPSSTNPGIEIGIQIGTATRINQSFDVATSFYADAYAWNGKTAIFYRGTDSNAGDSGCVCDGDAANGYGLSSGIPSTPQSRAAGGRT